ncbi:MAG: hypothetical protein U1C73_04050 [Dietzia sp.]|nr:hypothetical protein [Dietzia sp.]
MPAEGGMKTENRLASAFGDVAAFDRFIVVVTPFIFIRTLTRTCRRAPNGKRRGKFIKAGAQAVALPTQRATAGMSAAVKAVLLWRPADVVVSDLARQCCRRSA